VALWQAVTTKELLPELHPELLELTELLLLPAGLRDTLALLHALPVPRRPVALTEPLGVALLLTAATLLLLLPLLLGLPLGDTLALPLALALPEAEPELEEEELEEAEGVL